MAVLKRAVTLAVQEELTTDRASLAIVYGHRRIGKSTLIREAIKNRTHIFIRQRGSRPP